MNALKHGKVNIKSIVFIASTALIAAALCVLFFCLRILPTVALEQNIRCGMEEHIHGEACYEGDILSCKKRAHSHDGNCYIVLLEDNNINEILSLLGQAERPSLEYVITDVMSSALHFNSNLNSSSFTADTVALYNETISGAETLPNIVLNENLNSAVNVVADNVVQAVDITSDPSTTNYDANFYIYLDGKWTCIGTLPFTAARSGTRYNCTIPTADILELINGKLGTEYSYESFDLAVSTSQNSGYGTVSMASVTTTIATRQSTSASRSARYVRLIPNNGTSSSTAFDFFTVEYAYPDGTVTTQYVRDGTTVVLPEGNYEWSNGNSTYAAGTAVTVTGTTTFTGTLLGPITFVNVYYDVAFPTVSGVTVSTKPTLAGLTTTTVRDEFTENSTVTLRNVSQHSVQGSVNGNTTGLSRVVQFKGWRVGTSDVILQPNTTLIWEELLQYASGSTLNLTAVWESEAVRTATFFIRFDSVAVDTDGNITGQDQNKYTKELFAAYVGGVDPSLGATTLHNRYHIADTTSDNSYGADQQIRALYGEKTDGVWLSAFPTDEYIFASLVEYAETGYLSVGGVPVKAEDLNDRAYAIRWYVFKAQDDAWHIDGKLVKKEGLIHVYKTFAGNKELITEAKTDFFIDAHDITAGTHTTLDLNNYTAHDDATDTYMWEITNVDYGELWTITEHPHAFADPNVSFSVYSEYTVMDAVGDQSIAGSGTSLTVSGMTYALDEGSDEVLRAEFTNIYNKSDSIVIKKQDSLTGVSIGGATFQLLQNGQPLTFRYDSVGARYLYDTSGGSETVLQGTANGYFEIAIENFSYNLGPITVREITPPTGYSPIGDILIGYTDDNGTVGILSGNSDLIKYFSGVLIVGNNTDSSSVTAKKSWDCPQTEWQPVTVQLLANGKLVTSVMAGVQPQAVLNAENNWQYTWDNLPVYVNGQKIEWSIRETMIGTEAAKADGSFVNWIASYELPIKSTDENGQEHVLLTVTNTTKRVMLRLTKTNLSKTLQLQGATFLLEAVDADGNVIVSEIAKTATTGENGTLLFDNLKAGVRYRLTETQAPEGYLKTDEYIYFTIHEDGSVTVEDSFYAQAGSTAYNILVRNAVGLPLPESGGTGIAWYYVGGLIVLAIAAGLYIDILRKRRCHH